jgi:hypothetical protein
LYENARVFKVGDGSISVEYKSPSSCEIKKDHVYVYNSCDIAKEALVPLSETKTRDEIATEDIEIECGGEWTGTIHLEQTISLSCQAGIHSLSISFTNAGLLPSASPSSLLDEIQLSQEEEAIELKLIIMSDLYETAKVNHTYHKKITAEGRKDVIYDKNSTLDHAGHPASFLECESRVYQEKGWRRQDKRLIQLFIEKPVQ